MGNYLLFLTIIVFSAMFYVRYFPVKNIPCRDTGCMDNNTIVLDIRDYNESKMDLSQKSINIPYGYLKRYYREVTSDNIHVVASNRLELNLGLRFLKRKGFNIVSFHILDCPCKKVG